MPSKNALKEYVEGGYLKQFSQPWIKTDNILTYFSNTNPNLSYQNFVEDSEPDDITIIKDYTIDLA